MSQDNPTISKTCAHANSPTDIDDKAQSVISPIASGSIRKPLGSPACYGAASVFSHESEICQSCSYFDACNDECLITLDAINASVDISPVLKRHEAGRKYLLRQ